MAARADPPGASLPTSAASLRPCTLHALNTPSYFQFPGCIMLFLASKSQHLLCPVLFIPLFPSRINSTDPSVLHLEPLSPGSLPGYPDQLVPPTVPRTGRSAPAAFLPTALLVGGWVGGCGWCTP